MCCTTTRCNKYPVAFRFHVFTTSRRIQNDYTRICFFCHCFEIEISLFLWAPLTITPSDKGQKPKPEAIILTHWRRVTHICVNKLTIIGSDNGLSPGRRQAIIWTNAGIVNWTLGNKLQWNLNRNLNIFMQLMQLKVSSGKWRPSCLGLNVLTNNGLVYWRIYACIARPRYVNQDMLQICV